MGQPGMRITVDAAMRARDVSRPRPEGEGPPQPVSQPPAPGDSAAGAARRTKAAKNERRRLGKRGGAPRRPSADGA
ncbi:hypothetical protein [Actinomadura decatromicini]|uniref:Uncharacterized protein n=1 Tax=Actinomadura decatromicini TaxID=2604572 RepID=A0A5D3FVK0_9ACTN|nr:hypothetical protein [Actinomadura decatromicini]TYK52321.1 hypothetical protein FXF68_00520 [Actinomadura decatromicini]